MIGSVNTVTIEEIMPDPIIPGDQLEAKAEVTAQSSGSETDHSTTHSQNKGSLKLIVINFNFTCLSICK